jgi:hypothetical protein
MRKKGSRRGQEAQEVTRARGRGLEGKKASEGEKERKQEARRRVQECKSAREQNGEGIRGQEGKNEEARGKGGRGRGEGGDLWLCKSSGWEGGPQTATQGRTNEGSDNYKGRQMRNREDAERRWIRGREEVEKIQRRERYVSAGKGQEGGMRLAAFVSSRLS